MHIMCLGAYRDNGQVHCRCFAYPLGNGNVKVMVMESEFVRKDTCPNGTLSHRIVESNFGTNKFTCLLDTNTKQESSLDSV